MLVSIFLTAVVIASGAVVTYLYEDDAPLAARLCSGAVLGLTSFGLIGFAVAERLGLTPLSIAISTTIVALPLLLLRDQERYRRLNADALYCALPCRMSESKRSGARRRLIVGAWRTTQCGRSSSAGSLAV